MSSCIEPGKFDIEKVLGEWVVDYEMRPMSNKVLGRLLKIGEETPRVDSISVSIRKHDGNSSLAVLCTDGRAFLAAPLENCPPGHFKVVISPSQDVAVAFSEDPLSIMWSTWDGVLRRIAAEAYQMDPLEWWVVDCGGVGDDAYLVVADGDFRTRLQILRRPGNSGGSLHSTVRGRILAWAAGEGFDCAGDVNAQVRAKIA